MMSMPQTPGGRGAPRMSGIPTPGARSTSGIPTPGRPRSTTHGQSDNQWRPSNPSEFLNDAEAMRALNEAIRANDPAQHRLTADSLLSSVSSDVSGRRSAAGKPPSSYIAPRASTSSAASSNSNAGLRPKTPSSAASSSFRTSQTPRSSTTSVSSRPASRTSDVFGRTPSRQSQHHQPPPNRALDLGDLVRIESLGVEGALQFLGETEFKAGVWAGVELTGQYAGKGKNDGTVNGYVDSVL
jgi:CAP-Gly domain-containing linker protein 1